MSLNEQLRSDHPPALGKVLHVPAGQGPSVWLNGDVYTVKVDTAQSGGTITLLEASVPPGGGPPAHDHRNEDEAFYLLEGELEFFADGQTYDVRAGDFVFVPKGTVHRFRNKGLHAAKQLLIFTPSGFEEFFLQAGVDARPGEPIPVFDPADNPRAKAIAESLGSFQAPEVQAAEVQAAEVLATEPVGSPHTVETVEV
ncbi:quercetin 2,3-dioxygenase [Streptomyces sp. SP17BM10]|uniref:quercetin 2,3-dioxygenase n=1 Tax=Streptomyces sp. SP17BM10 TaxID=3002530 RepID=UPI002E7A8CA4|nr:quercetin 2,3-dioxygenase [Streptomyces sp. SP17BM10]MEE1788802.1 quercetin 2,3-dioxygenase [Streptomyces sp. SP17BM10]